jgi:hypothetical protein
MFLRRKELIQPVNAGVPHAAFGRPMTTFNRAEEALHEAYRQTDTGGVRAVYRRADGRHEVRDQLATEPDLVMEALVLNGAILPKPADLAAVTAALAAFWRAA